jgi:hypothetical protein
MCPLRNWRESAVKHAAPAASNAAAIPAGRAVSCRRGRALEADVQVRSSCAGPVRDSGYRGSAGDDLGQPNPFGDLAQHDQTAGCDRLAAQR